MQVRLLLGPAGSGKTFRCLTELRHALSASPDGPPLLLIAPRQTTYQLERQLLSESPVPGYTRLHILSFERLAHFIFERLHQAEPRILDEEGRVMVLRGLLAKKRDELKLFRASARLTGFAQQLSLVLRDLQRNQVTPEALEQLSAQLREVEGLSHKLRDLALLLRSYLEWLRAHRLQDSDCLLGAAAEALRGIGALKTNSVRERSTAETQRNSGKPPKAQNNHQLELSLAVDRGSKVCGPSGRALSPGNTSPGISASIPGREDSAFGIAGLWVDGFSEYSPQELELLAALAPHCENATLTFCLERVPAEKMPWLSTWSIPQQAFEDCKKRLEGLPGINVATELLQRHPSNSRFVNNPVLRHLEAAWTNSDKPSPASNFAPENSSVARSLRVAACADPEAEAILAAREILRHVRNGGRYREITVLVRNLESYHQLLQRVFSRYEIPYFLDRREPISHHPLAELTRSALRTVAFHWQRDDWFAALKTGLVGAADKEIDELENEALARGWKGADWHEPIRFPESPRSEQDQQRLAELESRLEQLRKQIMPAFQRLALTLGAEQNRPSGVKLAAALGDFWGTSNVEQRLQQWASAESFNSELRIPNSVHATVWSQMKAWLDNIEMAFSGERLPLREWLPILDAGLANLSVGVIPPALDQVLIGAIDRSRNPDIKLALVLGMNETVFPARPEPTPLFTETDCDALEKRNISVGAGARRQLGRERHYAYIACSRARERLVMTCALRDSDGGPLNPSPFLSRLTQIFPSLEIEQVPAGLDWSESEHANELIVPLLSKWKSETHEPTDTGWRKLAQSPALAPVLNRLRQFDARQTEEMLSPTLAANLYGPALRTSVSRMEQFAACPFKFFIHSGLRAEERKSFELDLKEKGTFQHDVLAEFHHQLRREGLRWRDISPEEARERVGRIAQAFIATYRDGLLQATEESRFAGMLLTRSLQDFIQTVVGWMREQYQFDPVAVELPFGEEGNAPFKIELAGGRTLELRGRIDRVDVLPDSAGGKALCVVIDYKSSRKQLDPVLLAHGLQVQLLAYLNVLRRWPEAPQQFGVEALVPAGVFYVNLRGKFQRGKSRLDALAELEQSRKGAYRHSGRFDVAALRYLDSRPEAFNGDQFSYRITGQGDLYKNSREGLPTAEFLELLGFVEAKLKEMGEEIFSGNVAVSPYRKASVTACDQCEYRSVCRIDPWTHRYRFLKKLQGE
jgi:ATP-dependent helicase/nuclease subunit B